MTASEFPPPYAFGLPAHFTSWRPDQVKAFQLILDSPTRFVALNMPTGSGKSLSYMAAIALLPTDCRGVVLTSTKGLQDQAASDFLELGLTDVRGQSNYACKAMQPGGEWQSLRGQVSIDPGCNEGPCHAGAKCTLKEAGCTYYDLLRQGRQGHVLTNYALWLAQTMYGQGLGDSPDVLVLDEAHQAVDELAGCLTIEIPHWLLQSTQTKPLAGTHIGIPAWRTWGVHNYKALSGLLDSLGAPKSSADAKYKAKLTKLHRLLFRVSQMSGTGEWVEDHGTEAFRFECLRPEKYAESLLFQGARKVVFTSATLTPKTLQMLGVPGDVTYWECPSSFPVARRPVYYIPTTKVDSRMTQYHVNEWIMRLDQILDQRPNVKGIIHTISYKRRDQILALSRHAARFRHAFEQTRGDREDRGPVQVHASRGYPLIAQCDDGVGFPGRHVPPPDHL
jgi:ATP-dependent DNA helicase DinG